MRVKDMKLLRELQDEMISVFGKLIEIGERASDLSPTQQPALAASVYAVETFSHFMKSVLWKGQATEALKRPAWLKPRKPPE
jgi:hypothetical protein